MASNHHVYQDAAGYPIEYEEDVWDAGVAHEVTVEEGDEYIQVEEMDEAVMQGQYIEHSDGQVYDEHMQPIPGGLRHHHPHTPLDLLPLRPDGTPMFTIQPTELVSRHMMIGNQHSTLCFNRKCQPQLIHDGHVYTLTGTLNQMAYNIWRCSIATCPAQLRTSPNFANLKLRVDHQEGCQTDDVQTRARIALFDIQLMCEFISDIQNVYFGSMERLKLEQPDVAMVLPPFEILRPTLEHHSTNFTYRKMFEMRKTLQQRRKEGLVIERSKFKRTKAFPPSICAECNQEFPSGDLAPSQDLLVQHLTYQHERPLVIERFTFPDPVLFEQWIRELCQHSRYRMRKVGLYDEHMYYLCTSDDRQQRCNHGRGSIIQTQCSAFIRVHDWRYILRREIKQVIVDYCLDHVFHSGDSPLPDSYRTPVYDYYSPEVFMKELESRKSKTAKLLVNGPQSTITKRRPMNDNHLGDYQHLQPGQDVDNYGFEDQYTHEEELPPPHEWEDHYEQNETAEQSMESSHQRKVTFNLKRNQHIPILKESSEKETGFLKNFQSNHVTVRENFEDRATFEVVLQTELQCDLIKQRLQQCRRADIAKRYLQRITGILEDIIADPFCSPKSNGNAMDPGPGPSQPRIRRMVRRVQRIPEPEESESQPPERHAMFMKRGENGEVVVVRKVIRKPFRRAVQLLPGEETIVQSSQRRPRTEEPVIVDDEPQEIFVEHDLDHQQPPPKRSQRTRRPKQF